MVFGIFRRNREQEIKSDTGTQVTISSDRYAGQKHIIGEEGQEKLKKARVLVVGCGGIGAAAVQYLAAAGIGRIGLVDNAYIDITDIQKQPIYRTSNVGKRKVFVLADSIKEINPEVVVVPNTVRLRNDNAMKILKDYDVIIDAGNDLPTHYLLSDSSVLLNRPLVFASVTALGGRVAVFDSKGPCYRCIYPNPAMDTTSGNRGVLGPAAGLTGIMQAAEAIKAILGNTETLAGRIIAFSLDDMRFFENTIEKNENCAACGKNPAVKELIDYDVFCGTKAVPEPAAAIFKEEPTNQNNYGSTG